MKKLITFLLLVTTLFSSAQEVKIPLKDNDLKGSEILFKVVNIRM